MESSELRSGARRQIVDLLAGGALSAPELAERLDLHVTTVRFHLDRLVVGGVVARRRSPDHKVGRPRLLYFLLAPSAKPRTRPGDRLHDLASVLLAGFHPDENGNPVSPDAAGRRWSATHVAEAIDVSAEDLRPARTPGQWLGKVGRMIDLLEAWGYGPELARYDGGTEIDVRLLGCPFLDLARADPEVVCGIHGGVIRGALAVLGESGADVTLEPFTDPPLCRLRFTAEGDLVARQGAH